MSGRNPQKPLNVSVVETINGFFITKIEYPGRVVRFGIRKITGPKRWEPVHRTAETIEEIIAIARQ